MTEEKQYGEHLHKHLTQDGHVGSPDLDEGLKNYLIDIDGVVCEDCPNEEPERMVTAEEIPGSREQINSWYEEGHIITFFTARTEDLRDITETWLKEKGFRYHKVICGKPRGGNYHIIDDKPVKTTHFKGTF